MKKTDMSVQQLKDRITRLEKEQKRFQNGSKNYRKTYKRIKVLKVELASR